MLFNDLCKQLIQNKQIKIKSNVTQKRNFISINEVCRAIKDLINYFDKLVPMDDQLYIHSSEGKDDMPAHIKSALTNNQISLSIKESRLILGTWQGIYLFEHRLDSHKRTIVHHYIGD